MVALFLFLKGMTGALAPFSYPYFNPSFMFQVVEDGYEFFAKRQLVSIQKKTHYFAVVKLNHPSLIFEV